MAPDGRGAVLVGIFLFGQLTLALKSTSAGFLDIFELGRHNFGIQTHDNNLRETLGNNSSDMKCVLSFRHKQ